ncbi:hypothetical protein [Metaclostridioides mangenotii]|uniref:Uncharacterized protein n=1 Tax=Metaclostridioides mangenotii TaxID=1540 RepID=A0ABS4EDZ9_9FIRM|nr:hypothetical protein [Clostridioides mangenotii]MBP1856170.1 hypothetical protein [Clostridioides mangenotii]
MKFLGNLEQIKDNKYKASLVAQDVEERAKRRGLTVEEFAQQVLENKTGLVVDKLPEQQKIEGKVSILYVNIDTKEPFYEYEDIPKTEENILKDRVNELEQGQANTEYVLMMGGLL